MYHDDHLQQCALDKGFGRLSDGELLALALPIHLPSDLLRSIQVEFRTPLRLAQATPRALTAFALQITDAIRLGAAIEIGRRSAFRQVRRGECIQGSSDVFALFRSRAQQARQEQFWCLFVDAGNRKLREAEISIGTLSATLADPREVFAPAISERAAGVILIHNHPSGDSRPSDQDRALTDRMVAVGDLLGIRVLDHVIVTGENYYSFSDSGLMGTSTGASSSAAG